jgi:hypothetical protein
MDFQLIQTAQNLKELERLLERVRKYHKDISLEIPTNPH